MDLERDQDQDQDKEWVGGDYFEHSVAARSVERSQLAADLEAFLRRGGNIQEIPKDLRADPPKKPENNYGRGSI